MKKTLSLLFVLVLLVSSVAAVAEGVDLPAFVLGMENTILTYDAQAAQPNEEEIRDMLAAAMKAPTGLNRQPYWITVITDYEIQMELALTPEVKPTPGTVMFIYSHPSDQNASGIDFGVSYAFLHVMAQAHGYGTHIFGQPARMLAQTNDFAKYGIPDGYTPLEFVLVSKSDTVDATSAATNYPREEKFNFLEVGK